MPSAASPGVSLSEPPVPVAMVIAVNGPLPRWLLKTRSLIEKAASSVVDKDVPVTSSLEKNTRWSPGMPCALVSPAASVDQLVWRDVELKPAQVVVPREPSQ